MKIISKIKALFRYRNQDAELTVSAAEIKKDKVFLHPLDDENHVICMKATAVDIIINPHENIREEDIQILEVKKSAANTPSDAKDPKKKSEEAKPKERKSRNNNGNSNSHQQKYTVPPISYYMPKMRTVSFTMYEDE